MRSRVFTVSKYLLGKANFTVKKPDRHFLNQ